MEELLQAVRKAASPRIWSVGVTMARGQRVSREGQAGNEITLRVSAPAQPVPHVVVIDVVDHAWSCDCPSREDPCAHVCAAAIALNEADKGTTAIAVSTRTRLGVEHDLVRENGTLVVRRALVSLGEDGAREPLTERLGKVVEARQREVDFVIARGDLEVDHLLDRARKKPLDSKQVGEIIAELDGHPRVRLDGAPVGVNTAVLMPRGRVTRRSNALIFEIAADPSLQEVIVPGLGRADGKLRPLGEQGLAGARWEKLPIIERYERERWAELIGERLPLMSARFPVDLDARDVPGLAPRQPPRIDLGMSVDHGRISVAPELVYGRPPALRIERGKAIYLAGAVPQRDPGAERAILERLRDELNMVPGRRIEMSGPDAQQFLEKLKAWNRESDDEQTFDLDVRSRPLVPRIELDQGRFRIAFETSEGSPTRSQRDGVFQADPRAVLEAWQAGFAQVPLLDGGFAPLPIDWLERHGTRLIALLAARDESERTPPALLPDLALLADSLDAPPPPDLARLAPLVGDFTGIPRAELPSDVRAELRPYQRRGVDWLAFLRAAGLGAVLADDMGLGKTLQTICVLKSPTLVVCPTSVVHNWVREIERFRPSLKTCTYHGPKRALDPAADVVITTYALLRLDQSVLATRAWETVVLDEAQAIKNADSQSARAAFELRANFRVSLSGTPLENRLEELWSQLHFTNPGLLGGRRDFEVQYARPIGDGHQGRAAELRQRIRPFILRRIKEDVAPELPPRTDTVVYAELTPPEREVYEAIRLATRDDVMAQLAQGGSIMGALEALLRLRQAACHPALVPGQAATTSSKLEALVERLADVVGEGHRALVFSQWTGLLDLTERDLDRAGIERLRLDGSTTDRASIVERFQSGRGPAVFLISLKAGGVGLNLTAADHVFFLDPWWNPAVEEQAADRAHRIGQTRPVFVHRIVAKDTVEEKILLLQDKKRRLVDAALGDGGAAAALTREDLLALLE